MSSAVTVLLLAVAGGLVFAASAATGSPHRFPRRVAGSGEEPIHQVVHARLALHLALGVGVAAAVLDARLASPAWLLPFYAAILAARILGEAIGAARPEIGRHLGLLLAPIEGLTLLLGWVLSPLLRLRGMASPQSGKTVEAYENVLDLTQSTVEQVMTPRSEVHWLEGGAGLPQVLETLRAHPHAHYPVVRGDFEQLLGMVDVIDLLDPQPPDATAADLARPAVVVPETIGCDDLLARMREDRFDTAVVVDEFGGIAGLVTLEDLLEIIVGDLVGEHEAVPVRVRRVTSGVYLVDATLRIDEFEEMFQAKLPDGDYETLAGLFLSRVVRIPTVGERIQLDALRMEVAEADPHRIRVLRVVFEAPASKSRRD